MDNLKSLFIYTSTKTMHGNSFEIWATSFGCIRLIIASIYSHTMFVQPPLATKLPFLLRRKLNFFLLLVRMRAKDHKYVASFAAVDLGV